MLKGGVPSAHHATNTVWNKWVAAGSSRKPRSHRNLGNEHGLARRQRFCNIAREDITQDKGAAPYKKLPENEKQHALLVGPLVGPVLLWQSIRGGRLLYGVLHIVETAEGEGELSQIAEVTTIQLSLDITEWEKWMVLYLYTDSWTVANAMWRCLEQWEQSNWHIRRKPTWVAALWQGITAWVENLVVKVFHIDVHIAKN